MLITISLYGDLYNVVNYLANSTSYDKVYEDEIYMEAVIGTFNIMDAAGMRVWIN